MGRTRVDDVEVVGWVASVVGHGVLYGRVPAPARTGVALHPPPLEKVACLPTLLPQAGLELVSASVGLVASPHPTLTDAWYEAMTGGCDPPFLSGVVGMDYRRRPERVVCIPSSPDSRAKKVNRQSYGGKSGVFALDI